MISSVSSDQNYWKTYYSYAATNSTTAAEESTTTTSSDDVTDAIELVDSTDSKSTTESYSPEDHMKMMRGMKPMGPPPPKPSGSDEDTDVSSLLSEIDSDDDDSITEEEYAEYLSASENENTVSTEDFFKTFDSDEDGKVTSAEIEKVGDNQKQGVRPMGPPPSGGAAGLFPDSSNTQQDSTVTSDDSTDTTESEISMLILNALKAYEKSDNYLNNDSLQENSILNSVA